jgi:hypothetical protein
LKWFNKVPFSILVSATLLMGLGMLYFGIRFKGYRPANNVKWLPSGQGLFFDRFGIAYTNDFFPSSSEAGGHGGLTIEIAFRSADVSRSSFHYLLCVYAGDDRRQLLIGQWSHWLIIMNGNDYDGKQGTGKVYVNLGQVASSLNLLTVISGEKGTDVYLNGARVKNNQRLRLFYPNRPDCKTRLILGNSIRGRSPWHGTISDLALYDVALSDSEMTAHWRQWAVGKGIAVAGTPVPKIRYQFDRPAKGRVKNLASDAYPLNVPSDMTILRKEFLVWPEVSELLALGRDMAINLLGFMPLGFMLCVVFSRCRGFVRRHNWWVTVGLAFAFSLSLEIAQAWIPSRDSSLLDLILNTVGAGLGAGGVSGIGWWIVDGS